MENNPEAPVAPEAKSVATPNTNDSAEAQTPAAPDMHGFTSEQLADMKKFFDNNGGFDAVKSKSATQPQPRQKSKSLSNQRNLLSLYRDHMCHQRGRLPSKKSSLRHILIH